MTEHINLTSAENITNDNTINENVSNENITEHNTKLKDNSGRLIFQDPVLCAQFFQDYVDIPELKNIRPEDIEDVTIF